MTDEDIDFSDIPPLTEEQLARMTIRLPGEAPRPRVTVSVDVGPDVAD